MALLGVGLDDRALLGRQRAGLEQDRVGDRDLADVVQRRRVAEALAEVRVHADLLGEQRREAPYPLDVRAGVLVAELDGHRETADGLGLRDLELGERAACSSCERPSISCSSALRRLSPTPQPSRIAATASTARQTTSSAELASITAPAAAASASTAHGAHSSARREPRRSGSGERRPRFGLEGLRSTPATLPPADASAPAPSAPRRAGCARLPLPSSRRVWDAPRRAGRRKLAWITPLTLAITAIGNRT